MFIKIYHNVLKIVPYAFSFSSPVPSPTANIQFCVPTGWPLKEILRNIFQYHNISKAYSGNLSISILILKCVQQNVNLLTRSRIRLNPIFNLRKSQYESSLFKSLLNTWLYLIDFHAIYFCNGRGSQQTSKWLGPLFRVILIKYWKNRLKPHTYIQAGRKYVWEPLRVCGPRIQNVFFCCDFLKIHIYKGSLNFTRKYMKTSLSFNFIFCKLVTAPGIDDKGDEIGIKALLGN